jgi:hypothetical protein
MTSPRCGSSGQEQRSPRRSRVSSGWQAHRLLDPSRRRRSRRSRDAGRGLPSARRAQRGRAEHNLTHADDIGRAVGVEITVLNPALDQDGSIARGRACRADDDAATFLCHQRVDRGVTATRRQPRWLRNLSLSYNDAQMLLSGTERCAMESHHRSMNELSVSFRVVRGQRDPRGSLRGGIRGGAQFRQIPVLAKSDATVLISGEADTGKEPVSRTVLVAHVLRDPSSRPTAARSPIRCSKASALTTREGPSRTRTHEGRAHRAGGAANHAPGRGGHHDTTSPGHLVAGSRKRHLPAARPRNGAPRRCRFSGVEHPALRSGPD